MAEADPKAAARRQFLRAAVYAAPVIASTVVVRLHQTTNSCTPQTTCPPVTSCAPSSGCNPGTSCGPTTPCRPGH